MWPPKYHQLYAMIKRSPRLQQIVGNSYLCIYWQFVPNTRYTWYHHYLPCLGTYTAPWAYLHIISEEGSRVGYVDGSLLLGTYTAP